MLTHTDRYARAAARRIPEMEKACAEMHHCFLAKRLDPAQGGALSESEVGRAAMLWRFGGAADCPME
jgi:hypothetical protein